MHYDEDIQESVRIDALDETPLSDELSFVCVVSSSGNAFEVEKEVLRQDGRKKKNKRKCACLLFHDGRTKFTLKLSGFMSEFHLKPIYEKLTEAETNAKIASGVTDQRFLRAGWGGSDEIGGPPRYPNGAGSFLSIGTIKRIAAEELSRQMEENRSAQSKEASASAGPKAP